MLKEFKGIGDTGADIYLREVQDVWTWVRPYFDERATAAAKALGLPTDPAKLGALAPRANARLAAALVRVSLRRRRAPAGDRLNHGAQRPRFGQLIVMTSGRRCPCNRSRSARRRLIRSRASAGMRDHFVAGQVVHVVDDVDEVRRGQPRSQLAQRHSQLMGEPDGGVVGQLPRSAGVGGHPLGQRWPPTRRRHRPGHCGRGPAGSDQQHRRIVAEHQVGQLDFPRPAVPDPGDGGVERGGGVRRQRADAVEVCVAASAHNCGSLRNSAASEAVSAATASLSMIMRHPGDGWRRPVRSTVAAVTPVSISHSAVRIQPW